MIDHCMLWPGVCVSVCLSITRRYCVEAAERNILQSIPHGTVGFEFFLSPKILTKIDHKRAPNICRPNSMTAKNVRLSTNNSPYLGNGMLYQMVVKLRDSNVETVQNTDMVTVEDDRKSRRMARIPDLEWPWRSLQLFETFLKPITQKIWHVGLLASTHESEGVCVISKLKDLSWLQAVTNTVKVVISRKLYRIVAIYYSSRYMAYQIAPFPMTSNDLQGHVLQAYSNAIFRTAVKQMTRFSTDSKRRAVSVCDSLPQLSLLFVYVGKLSINWDI